MTMSVTCDERHRGRKCVNEAESPPDKLAPGMTANGGVGGVTKKKKSAVRKTGETTGV